MESGQKTASYEGTQLLRGSGSALTAMGTWPASIRGEVRRALPLLNRLDPLHSAAVAAQGHQATCLGIKSSTVLAISASVPAARRKRQRGDLMAVSSAGKQGGAVGGQLRLGRHPTACLTSTAYRLPCRSTGGSHQVWPPPVLAEVWRSSPVGCSVPFGRIAALAVMIPMLKRTQGHAWSALQHWLLI